MEEAAVGRSRAFVPDQRLVGTGAVDVAAGDRGAGLVQSLGREIVVVIGEQGAGREREAAERSNKPM
jgi:hypothetical protein